MIWRFSAITYFQFMLSGNVVAGIFNSRREKKSDKWFRWTDIHPFHSQTQKQSIGGAQLLAATLAMAGDVQWEFAPGMTLEKIIGGQWNEQQSD